MCKTSICVPATLLALHASARPASLTSSAHMSCSVRVDHHMLQGLCIEKQTTTTRSPADHHHQIPSRPPPPDPQQTTTTRSPADHHHQIPPPCVFATQMPYAQFMSGLASQNVSLNRKALSELAMTEPFSFKALVDQVRFMRGVQAPDRSQ
eukprot:365027-Chlamydomonas_euryale.AAC.5